VSQNSKPLSFEIPKVIRPLRFEEYDPGLKGHEMRVWVNFPRTHEKKYMELSRVSDRSRRAYQLFVQRRTLRDILLESPQSESTRKVLEEFLERHASEEDKEEFQETLEQYEKAAPEEIESFIRELLQLEGSLDETTHDQLHEQMERDSLAVHVWIAGILSQDPDAATHISGEELFQRGKDFTEKDSTLWEWFMERIWGLVLEHRESARKKSRTPYSP
jgi:hypothetical protein